MGGPGPGGRSGAVTLGGGGLENAFFLLRRDLDGDLDFDCGR